MRTLPNQTRLAVWTILAAVLFAAPQVRADEEVLRFTQTLVDFGAITDVEPVYRSFSFVNITQRTVQVGMTYCHFCDEPLLDKRTLAPGETGTVVLMINPAGRKGQVAASATLQEIGKPRSGGTIEIKAEVCPRVWVEPANIFPKIITGDANSAQITVTGRTKNFKVTRIDADTPIEGFDLGPTTEVDECGSKATQQKVTIRFSRDLPLGPYTNRLRVITSDERADPRLVSVDGAVAGRISFEPQSIGISLTPNQLFMQEFDVVVAHGGGAVIIESVDITKRDEAQELALDVQPTANPSKVRVRLCGKAPARERQFAEIRVEIVARSLDSSGSETLTVPITMIVFHERPANP